MTIQKTTLEAYPEMVANHLDYLNLDNIWNLNLEGQIKETMYQIAHMNRAHKNQRAVHEMDYTGKYFGIEMIHDKRHALGTLV